MNTYSTPTLAKVNTEPNKRKASTGAPLGLFGILPERAQELVTTDLTALGVLVHLVLRAYKEHNRIAISQNELANLLNITRDRARRKLEKLEKLEYIRRIETRQGAQAVYAVIEHEKRQKPTAQVGAQVKTSRKPAPQAHFTQDNPAAHSKAHKCLKGIVLKGQKTSSQATAADDDLLKNVLDLKTESGTPIPKAVASRMIERHRPRASHNLEYLQACQASGREIRNPAGYWLSLCRDDQKPALPGKPREKTVTDWLAELVECQTSEACERLEAAAKAAANQVSKQALAAITQKNNQLKKCEVDQMKKQQTHTTQEIAKGPDSKELADKIRKCRDMKTLGILQDGMITRLSYNGVAVSPQEHLARKIILEINGALNFGRMTFAEAIEVVSEQLEQLENMGGDENE